MVIRTMKYFIFILMVTANLSCKSQDSSFTSQRVQDSAVILLDASIVRVFPLFGMMKERDWSPGWNPTPVFPQTGEITEGAVYRTPGHVHGEGPLTWVVSRYDTSASHLTYLITAPDRVVTIDIRCAALSDSNTRATITYTLTGLTEEGNEICHHLLLRQFTHRLQDWQTAINQYLTTAYKHTP